MPLQYTDEELELIRQALARGERPLDPHQYRGPDVMAQAGRVMEGAGRDLEGTLQAEDALGQFAELIPRMLVTNPLQGAGAALQVREPEVKAMVAGAKQAAQAVADDPVGVGKQVAGKVAEADFPMQMAEGMSVSDLIAPMSGLGKAAAAMGMAAGVPKKIAKRLPGSIERQRLEGQLVEKPGIAQLARQRQKDLISQSNELNKQKGKTLYPHQVRAEKMKLSRESRKLDEIIKAERGGESVDIPPELQEAMEKAYQGKVESKIAAFDALDDSEKYRLDRAVEQGFELDAFHGTKGKIDEFDPGLLGTTTDAPSARIGFFFSADPETAAKYASAAKLEDVRPEMHQELSQVASQMRSKIDDKIASQSQILTKEVPAAKKAIGADALPKDHPLIKKSMQLDGEIEAMEVELDDMTKGEKIWMSTFDNPVRSSPMRGENIMPVKLRLQDPLIHDFKGKGYRDVSYRELLDRAKREGKDGAVLKNTHDGGPITDIYVVFRPSQIRGRFAKFDPKKAASGNILAGAAPLVAPMGAGAAAAAYLSNKNKEE